MSAWDPEELLQPVTAQDPCGENLEDTALMAAFDALRLFGQPPPDPENPRPRPSWPDVRQQSLDALRRSKDLRLLVHLAAAVLWTDGLAAFGRTLGVASQWLDRWWVETWPRVDEDAIPRRSALNCLADQHAVLAGLRGAVLVQSRQHGIVTVRSLDSVPGLQPQGKEEVRPEGALVVAAFAEMPLPELTDLQATVAGATTAVSAITARMTAQGGPEATPALEPLAALLAKVDRVVRVQLAARTGADVDAPDTAPDAPAPTVRPVGAIASRADAVAALDAVAEFFRRHEPASPVPLFVERARRLVGKDFLEVLEDVAPDGLPQARSAGGLQHVE